MRKFDWRPLLAGAGIAALGLAGGDALAQSTLRIVPQADLKILDTVWTTNNITSNHGYMVYDVLYAPNSKLDYVPQMVESHQRSADGLTWSFKLRDGLTFHDGSPVTAKDVVATIKRWGDRIPTGKTLMSFTKEVAATGPATFELRLARPFGPVLAMLGNPENPLFITREKEASLAADQQITDPTGSGPYIMSKDEWVQGAKVVYKKNPAYKPRPEPADGFAGGKLAKVDRVEWHVIPDANIAAQALIRAEVDAIEIPTTDLLPLMKRDPQHRGPRHRPHRHPGHFPDQSSGAADEQSEDPSGAAVPGRRSAGLPGLDDRQPRVREAVLVGIRLRHAVRDHRRGRSVGHGHERAEPREGEGPPEGRRLQGRTHCAAGPGGGAPCPYPGDRHVAEAEGGGDQRRPAHGRLGHPECPPRAQGRSRKEPARLAHLPPGAGGLAQGSPLTNAAVPTPCDGSNWFGWPCDETLKIRLEFPMAATTEEQRKVVERLQARFFEVVPYIPVGQFYSPVAYRKNLSGVLDTVRLVLWNVEKKG